MEDQLFIIMRWESNLTVNNRYTGGGRGCKLRPEVDAWQEELAWKAKIGMTRRRLDWSEEQTLVVDVHMRFPDDGVGRDADNYLKSIFDGLEMGLGIPDSRFIPLVQVPQVLPEAQAGFTIRVYPSTFRGRGLFGRVLIDEDGLATIVLDDPVPEEWHDQRVCLNLGMAWRCTNG